MLDSNKPLSLWRFTYRSRDPEEETAYRDHFLDSDIRQLSVITGLILIFSTVISLMDVPKIAADPSVITGIYIRGFYVILGLAVIWTVNTRRNPRIVDWASIVILFSAAVGFVFYHNLNDSSPSRIVAMATLIIFVAHTTFPSYASYVVLPMFLLLTGESYNLFVTSRGDLESERPLLVAVMLSAEIIAIIGSACLHRARYESFSATRKVKLLAGLIPICANCKKIRDDQGYYQQIEHYITEHSEAVFSHSICPQCVSTLYPQLKTDNPAK